ncbi:DUF2189 domain-containing protein [Salinarimonas sp.]|uniref:DUF2189 domain-containing protein n=1 Tax=Salinarimonas sp. TaxID=2766526 RepID=UPI0032D8EA0A
MEPRAASLSVASAAPRPAVRRITSGDVRAALAAGYRDFLAMPSHLVFVGLFYPLFGVVLGLVVFTDLGFALVFPLVSGFALVGPVAAAPLYEASRRREAGLAPSWPEALGALGRAGVSLVFAATLLAAIFAAWMLCAGLIYKTFYGAQGPESLLPFLTDVLTTPRGWGMIVVGHAVGVVFAAIAFTLGVISLPLLVDRDVGAGVALRTSVEAVRRNKRPMALWAALVAAILIVASAPLLVGLTVAMPILGHATWHLYRRIVDKASVEGTPRRR